MFSTAKTGQVVEQGLNVVKGNYQGFNIPLTKEGKFTSTTLGYSFPAGRVGSLTSAGEIQLGRASATAMPLYLLYGTNDPAISNDGTSPVSSKIYWNPVAPVGIASGLVATGGFELQTTEFDTAQSYAPNQLLTVTGSNASAGKLTNQGVTPYSTWVVGVTSFGTKARTIDAEPTTPVAKNAYGIDMLTFWTYFLPATA